MREEVKDEEYIRWEHSCPDFSTADGAWLFHSNPHSLFVLTQLTSHSRKNIRRVRWARRAEYQSLWRYSEHNAACLTANGRWLFASDDEVSCILMVSQQLRFSLVNHERWSTSWSKYHEVRERWAPENVEQCTADGRWLFEARGDCFSMLSRQLRGEML